MTAIEYKSPKVEGLGDVNTYAWLTALPVREQVVR